tara:strand:- start:3003 stop:3605 length:603 start_codon:yes stop_codon:yes gene_type:complete
MTEARRIDYRFLHWGPFVCQFKLLPKEVEEFKSLEKEEDYRDNLAGHLEDEKTLDKNKVFKLLTPYLNSYFKGYYDFRGKPLAKSYELISAWINTQKEGEFNPPHTHDGDLSFVVYTEVPKNLIKESTDNVSLSPGPGCITFDFNLAGTRMHKFFLQTHSHLPEVGDVFIFPAGLPHWVYPYTKTEGQRVSISGNLKLIE